MFFVVVVVITCYPLYYQSETTLESGIFSYKSHPYGHRYFVKEFLCIHTFIVHTELKLLGRWLPEAFFQLVQCFKYADNGAPDSMKSDPG